MKTVMSEKNIAQLGMYTCHDYLKSYYSIGYSIRVQWPAVVEI